MAFDSLPSCSKGTGCTGTTNPGPSWEIPDTWYIQLIRRSRMFEILRHEMSLLRAQSFPAVNADLVHYMYDGMTDCCPLLYGDRKGPKYCGMSGVCPFCGSRKANAVAKRYGTRVDAFSSPATVVLGHPPVAAGGLREALQLISNAFPQLRKSPVFAGVAGGFWRIEVSIQGAVFRPHVHAFVDGKIINSQEYGRPMAQIWADLCGAPDDRPPPSCRIDPVPAGSSEAATRYVVKGPLANGLEGARTTGYPMLCEAITTLREYKTGDSWGNARSPRTTR